MKDKLKIIGIDCSTEAKKTGLSLGEYSEGIVRLIEVKTGNNAIPVADDIKEWLVEGENALIAIDAPLGWPKALGELLQNHDAGTSLRIDSNILFRRETDRFIKKKIGIQPLDVGADRIARTAHAALNIMDGLRTINTNNVELCWDKANINGISAIEVYPAATLASHKIIHKGYKEEKDKSVRKTIVDRLQHLISIECNANLLEDNADALDSAVCLLAAKDFLCNDVYYPYDLGVAQKEGWIWVKEW